MERKIGEVFECDGKRLKVVADLVKKNFRDLIIEAGDLV